MNDLVLSDQVADLSLPGAAGGGRDVVSVRYWAGAKAATGVAEEALTGDFTAGATVAAIRAAAVARHPQAEAVLAVCAVLVDGLAADPDAVVPAAATVEFLPPFAGG